MLKAVKILIVIAIAIVVPGGVPTLLAQQASQHSSYFQMKDALDQGGQDGA